MNKWVSIKDRKNIEIQLDAVLKSNAPKYSKVGQIAALYARHNAIRGIALKPSSAGHSKIVQSIKIDQFGKSFNNRKPRGARPFR